MKHKPTRWALGELNQRKISAIVPGQDPGSRSDCKIYTSSSIYTFLVIQNRNCKRQQRKWGAPFSLTSQSSPTLLRAPPFHCNFPVFLPLSSLASIFSITIPVRFFLFRNLSRPLGVRLGKCLSRAGGFHAPRRLRIGESLRCLCSLAVSEPSTSQTSSSSVKY